MLAALAIAEVERIQEKYSRYDAGSFLSQINRTAGTGAAISLDEESAALMDYAFSCYQKSDGLFDITGGVLRQVWNFSSGRLPTSEAVEQLLPLIGMDKLLWDRPQLAFARTGMEIDLGGIGKEYAADRVAALLKEEGVEHALIDLGGDFFALGPQSDGHPWSIALRDPHHASSILGTVHLTQGGLATSGDYERCILLDGRRYSHILNPQTGWPARGLASVTVVAPQCMVAGALTTIAMLKQRDGIAWLSAMDLPHLWVDEEGDRGGTLSLESLNTTF